MKIMFMTFGCKVNQYETECMKELFLSEGWELTDDLSAAEAVVINSCTVTASGDNRSIHALKKAREANPHAVTVLTGCMPQASPEKAAEIKEADIVTGTKNRSSLPELVKEFVTERKRLIQIPDYSRADAFEHMLCHGYENKTRAFVKIQDGCNQFCTYCMIPYARGRCRSKPLDALKEEVKLLADSGHKEIVLVGINLMFYGKDTGCTIADAVDICCNTEGVERVRLGSVEPEMMTDETLRRLEAQSRLCPHFHLSLQSGCDKTLKAMNRHYTCDEYRQLVSKLREHFPDCAITTDIMVGFPGEKEEDFEQTMKFTEETGFARIHVFSYSKRQGTKAAAMSEQIPESVKKQRMKKLRELGDRLCEAHCRSLVGKVLPVLFEKENSPDHHRGHTPDYTVVKIPEKNFKKSLKKELFYVTIEDSEKDCCIGKIVTYE